MAATIELHGSRMWLRPIALGDAAELSRASHEECDPLLPRPRRPLSETSFRAWIRSLGCDDMVWAICRGGEDVAIGTVSLRNIDRLNSVAETGIGLLWPGDRGQGIGAEAKALVLNYAFGELGLHAVSATVDARNARSVRALKRQGYRLAGRKPADVHLGGGRFGETLVYDLLAREWMARRIDEGDT